MHAHAHGRLINEKKSLFAKIYSAKIIGIHLIIQISTFLKTPQESRYTFTYHIFYKLTYLHVSNSSDLHVYYV